MTALQKQLTSKIDNFLPLSVEHVKLADELSRVKSQNTAEITVSDDLKSVVEVCERPAKLAKKIR